MSDAVSSPSIEVSVASPNTPNTDSSAITPTPSFTPTMPTTRECGNGYICGRENADLRRRIEVVERELSDMSGVVEEKRLLIKQAAQLISILRIIVLAFPVAIICSMAVVQYFFYKDSSLLNFVTGVIGLVSIAECILVPIGWKVLESRVNKLEKEKEK